MGRQPTKQVKGENFNLESGTSNRGRSKLLEVSFLSEGKPLPQYRCLSSRINFTITPEILTHLDTLEKRYAHPKFIIKNIYKAKIIHC